MERGDDISSLSLDEARCEIGRLVDFIRSEGYRRCDIAACNCGSWHGGHAFARLRDWGELLEGMEISTNGKTPLQATSEALRDRDQVRASVAKAEARIAELIPIWNAIEQVRASIESAARLSGEAGFPEQQKMLHRWHEELRAALEHKPAEPNRRGAGALCGSAG